MEHSRSIDDSSSSALLAPSSSSSSPSLSLSSHAPSSVSFPPASATSAAASASSHPQVFQSSSSSLTSSPGDDASRLRARGHELKQADRLSEATECFSQACELVRLQHGERSMQCAPYFYDYGRALLALYQQSSTALGDVATEKQTQVHLGLGEGGLIGEDDVEEEEAKRSSPPSASSSFTTSSSSSSSSSARHEEKKESQLDEGNESESENAEADDLELAYQMLELARIIYTDECERVHALNARQSLSSSSSSASSASSPQPHQELIASLARTHEYLGEALQEWERFADAGIEFAKAQSLRRMYMPAWDHALCRNHMDMAACHLHEKQLEPAIHHYSQAAIVLHRKCLNHAREIARVTADAGDETVLSLSTDDALPSVLSDERDLASLTSKWANKSKALWSLIDVEKQGIKDSEEILEELKERIDDLRAERSRSLEEAMQMKQRTVHNAPPSSNLIDRHSFASHPFAIGALSFASSSSPANALSLPSFAVDSSQSASASPQEINILMPTVKRRAAWPKSSSLNASDYKQQDSAAEHLSKRVRIA